LDPFDHIDYKVASEGRLSFLKSCLVNNTFLAAVGYAHNLHSYIIAAENQLISSKDKIVADIIEAIIGNFP
jgi:dsRNA-specific ribonuclease